MRRNLFYILFFFLFIYKIDAQIAVVANKSINVNQLKKSQLIDIYTGEIRTWSSGDPIFVFDLKTEDETREDFYKLIGRSSSRMKSIWMKKLLSGEGEPPKEFSSQESLIKKIATTKGAIGFVSIEKVTNDVKVIKIIE